MYISDQANYIWKKREVSLLLIGTFAEDIQMFKLRNTQFDKKQLID